MTPRVLFLFFIPGFLFHSLDLVHVLRRPARLMSHFIGLAYRTTSSFTFVNFHASLLSTFMVEVVGIEPTGY